MRTLDDDFLREVGLGELDAATGRDLLRELLSGLEQRVGERLAALMTGEQLDEFELLVESDGDAASAFLTRIVPDHPQIAGEEFDALQAELIARSEEVLATALPSVAALAGVVEPTLLRSPGSDRCRVVSPQGTTVVGTIGPRSSCWYAARAERFHLLLLPSETDPDPSLAWCTDDGEVRLAIDGSTDLVWNLPDGPAAETPAVSPELLPRLDRPRLRAARTYVRDPQQPHLPSGTLEVGRWTVSVDDIVIADPRDEERHLRLRDWSARTVCVPSTVVVRPDERQVIATYRGPRGEHGIQACTTGYLEHLLAEPSNADDDPCDWEHRSTFRNALPSWARPDIEVGFDRTGRRCVVAASGTVTAYDADGFEEVGAQPDPLGAVIETVVDGGNPLDPIAVAPAGGAIAATGSDGRTYLADLDTPGPWRPLDATMGDPVAGSWWSPDAATFLGTDRRLVHIDPTGAFRVTDLPDGPQLTAGAISPQGWYLLGSDSTVEVWQGASCSRVAVPSPVRGLTSCRRAPGWIAAWLDDGSMWRIRVRRRRLDVERLPTSTLSLSRRASSRIVAALMRDVGDYVLTTETDTVRWRGGKVTHLVAMGRDRPPVLSESPNGDALVVGDATGRVTWLPGDPDERLGPRPIRLQAAVDAICVPDRRSALVVADGQIHALRALI